MALVVDTSKRYRNIPNGENFTFSLSKPFNELTVDDLLSAECWVGFNACSVNQISEGAFLGGIPENNPNYCNLWGTNADWWFDQTDWTTVHWSYPANFPDGVYMRNVYVNRDLNAGSYTIANTTARLVLEITPDANTTIQKLCMVGNENYLKAEYGSGSFDNQMSDYTYISPAMLIVVNNVAFLVNQNVQRFFVPDNIGFYIDSATAQGYQSQLPSFINSNYHKIAFGWTMGATSGSIEDNCVKTGTNSAPVYTYSNVNFNGHTGTFKLSGGGTNYHKRLGFSMADNADDSDFSLIHRAYTGVRFKVNDTWYKPIISGGIVTGYTTDMTAPSEWDNWTKASGHNVPSGGGGGGSEDNDKFESMTTGFSSAIGGITKYYKMSHSGLISLINDFNQHAPAGTTISNSIVSLYVNALDNSWTTVNTPIEIHTAGAQETPFTSVLEYPELYLFANPMKQLGYIDVPRVTNTFYDYNPYTTYELYIPFCGWIGLPDTIAGRRLRVELHIDLATMNCRALARCEVDNGHGYDSTLCGEISGAIGAPCPLEVIEGGLYRQSFVNSALQLVSGGTAAIVGGMSGANALMASGAMNAIQGLANARMAGNTNYTQVVGRSGDCSGLAGAHKCYLKISHPVVDKVVETSLFGHSVGYICDTVDKLKNFKGFTVCLNPHITINATQAEKEEIKRLLEDGVIL